MTPCDGSPDWPRPASSRRRPRATPGSGAPGSRSGRRGDSPGRSTRSAFSRFLVFDPATGATRPLSDGPGEQKLPVILSTESGGHAYRHYVPVGTLEDVVAAMRKLHEIFPAK